MNDLKLFLVILTLFIILVAIGYSMPAQKKRYRRSNVKIVINEKAETKMYKQEVYDFLARIPKGKVVTYGMIGKYLGNVRFAQTIGNILHENPDSVKYPCYKVVSSKGELSENYAFGGIEKQKDLLEKDRIKVIKNKVDLKQYKWYL